MFEFQALKGATYSARWGFSLNFVPTFRGKRLRSKRTAKGAEFDLCIDPIDELGSVPNWFSVFYFPGDPTPPAYELRSIASWAADAAQRDLARVTSVADLVTMFEERAQASFQRLSRENYVQTHLAWGLGLVAIGRREEGRAHIELFCERFNVALNNSVLRKAQEEAERYASAHALQIK